MLPGRPDLIADDPVALPHEAQMSCPCVAIGTVCSREGLQTVEGERRGTSQAGRCEVLQHT